MSDFTKNNKENWVQPEDLKEFGYTQREFFFLTQLENLPKAKGLDNAIESLKENLRNCLTCFDTNAVGESIIEEWMVLQADRVVPIIGGGHD